MTFESRELLEKVWHRRGCKRQRIRSGRCYFGGQSRTTSETREFLHLLWQGHEVTQPRRTSRRDDVAGLALALILVCVGASLVALSALPGGFGWVHSEALATMVTLLVITVIVSLIPYRIGKPLNSSCSLARERGFIASAMTIAIGFICLC
jgi:hypothetical protein